MKYKPELIREMAEWVATNGLIDYGGATLKSFCEEFGIEEKTYYRWLENDNFDNVIKNAKDRFNANRVKKIALSMQKAAEGYTVTEVKREFVRTDNGKQVVARRTEVTKEVAPNVAAGIFLLTNLAPNDWKNTQREQHSGDAMQELMETLPDDEKADSGKKG